MRDKRRVGYTLLVIGFGAIVVTLTASAMLAPNISATTDAGEEAGTLVGVQGAPSPGRVVLVARNGSTLWSYDGASSYHDVTMLANGSVLATPITNGHDDCGRFSSPCPRTGVEVLDRSGPSVQYRWTFPVRNYRDSEVHDAELLPSGRFVVADMAYERIFVLDPNGTITWQWNASEHYDAPPDPTRKDWLHINDVDRIGEGRYLVSVRNANQLVIVERGEGVVEVINEDGDRETLYQQHNPQYLGPDAVLVADSENDRVVELHERNGTWEVAWSLGSAGGLAFDWPRDADRLSNGNTLVTDSRNNRIVEVNASGGVVWSARVPGLPYEADRVSDGELVGAPRYESNGTDTSVVRTTEPSGTGGGVEPPLFDQLHAGLTHVAPVPFWLGPWHLLITVLGLLTGGAGGVVLSRAD